MTRFVFQKDLSGRFTKMYTGGEAGPDPDHYRTYETNTIYCIWVYLTVTSP